jgi:hypothetical protein
MSQTLEGTGKKNENIRNRMFEHPSSHFINQKNKSKMPQSKFPEQLPVKSLLFREMIKETLIKKGEDTSQLEELYQRYSVCTFPPSSFFLLLILLILY